MTEQEQKRDEFEDWLIQFQDHYPNDPLKELVAILSDDMGYCPRMYGRLFASVTS
jgi:hypothetical protein